MLGEFIFQGDVYNVKTTLDTITQQDHQIKFQSLKEAQFFFGRAASDPFTREDLIEVAQWLRPSTCRPRANCPAPTEEALLDELCLQVFKGDLILVIIKAPAAGMTMDDKEKCARLYEAFTGEHTEPSMWNEKAADLLAEMADKIKKCTQGMGWARAIWPSTSKITWLWVVKIPYNKLKNEMKIRKGWRNDACIDAGVDAYAELIKYELIK
jgi:hypothetical protein